MMYIVLLTHLIIDVAFSLQICRDSPSPPPGSLPHNFNHSVSCSSIHSGEGEFIPESDEVSCLLFLLL